MILVFELTMANCPSWNGRWSGEDRGHYLFKNFMGAKGGMRAAKLIADGPYRYQWDDGWAALISVREVDADEARRLRSRNAGFCGYDWMVETIVLYGQPLAAHQIKPFVEQRRLQLLENKNVRS